MKFINYFNNNYLFTDILYKTLWLNFLFSLSAFVPLCDDYLMITELR